MNSSEKKVFAVLFITIFIVAGTFLTVIPNVRISDGDAQAYQSLAADLGTFSSHLYGSQETTIFRSIGYPLFLGGIYNITSNSDFAVRVTQFFLLLFSAWLLFLLAGKFVEKKSAFHSSIICITYLPFIFYCLYTMAEILSIFLVVSAIFLVTRIEQNKNNKLSLLLGIVLGYLCLVKPSFLLLPVLIIAAVFFSKKIIFSEKLLTSFLLVFGLMICILPWTIRNKIVSDEFLLLATGKGVSLYVSAQQYNGELSYALPVSDWEKIAENDQERYSNSKKEIIESNLYQNGMPLNPRIEFLQDKVYTADALVKFKSIPIERYLLSYPIRVAYLFSTADVPPPNTYQIIHPLAQFQYAIFVILTFIGLLVQRKFLLKHYWLWLIPLYVILIHSVFHTEARYSLPARPFLCIYAGVGVSFIGSQLTFVKEIFYRNFKS